MSVEYSFESLDRKRVHCVCFSPQCKNPKAVVLMLHGLSEHSMWFSELADHLLPIGVSVHAHDHIGFGKSAGYRAHIKTFSQYVSDTIQHGRMLRQEHPNAPIFLIGHSLGGTIAIQTISRSCNMFAGCVLIGPAIEPDPEIATPAKLAVAKCFSRIFPQLKLGGIDPAMMYPDGATIDKWKADPLCWKYGPKAKQGVECLKAMKTIMSTTREFTCRFLILHGDDDKLARIQGSQFFFAQSNSVDKKMEVYPQGKHQLLHDSCKWKVMDDIVCWLDERC